MSNRLGERMMQITVCIVYIWLRRRIATKIIKPCLSGVTAGLSGCLSVILPITRKTGTNNSKSGRPYRPIGWHLQVRQGHYVKGIPRAGSGEQRHEQMYKQRKDEYNQLWLKHLDDWWDWVFKERERIGWTFVEKEDPSDYDDDSDAGITWGWLPDSKLTPEQRRRVRRPYTDNYFRPRA